MNSSKLAAFTLSLAVVAGLGASKAEANGAKQVFNVKSYGATGNGTTDDSAAINAAISAAGANSGSTLYFPSGTYLYSTGVGVTGLTVIGQNATLLAANNNSLFVVQGENPSVQNLNFRAAQATTIPPALLITNAKNATVSGINISPNFQFGMYLQTVTGATLINNNIAVNPIGTGIFIARSSGVTANQNTVNLASPDSSDYPAGIVVVQGTNTLIANNKLTSINPNTSNSGGIASSLSTGTTITSNTVNGWDLAVSSFADENPSITKNTVVNSGLFGILAGTIEATTSAAIPVSNNVVTTAGGVGIAVTGNSSPVTVSTNQISLTGSSAIYAGPYTGFGGAGSNVTITANAISNAGLSNSGTTPAVIYTNQTSATSVSITENQYKGNTANLTYFIDAVQPAPVSSVNGNKTNTLLPTKVGP